MDVELPIHIQRQPDYTTCGPTSLHAVYEYFGDSISLQEVIDQVHMLEGGGTLSINLAVHALRRGYRAEAWICNVAVWDPTWFEKPTDLRAKLRARFEAKRLMGNPRYAEGLAAIDEYLERGGRMTWGDLTPRRISGFLSRGLPILTGTNGTYLYQCARETEQGSDDIRGDAFGHFVVICGYHSKEKTVSIADPLKDNPLHERQYYRASIYRLLGAIFLGAATNDSNFLVITPKGWRGRRAGHGAAT
jgi:hypothetical protein